MGKGEDMEPITLFSNVSGLSGKVNIPGDKSISHRSVMFGSIASGTTTVKNFLPGEDCLGTIACFQKLGTEIVTGEDGQLVITGKGLDGLKEPREILDVGNSGTTIRLLMGLLAGRPFHSVLVGDESISTRPMTRVVKPLTMMGAEIWGREGGEYAPLSISGGGLKGIEYTLPVASAQIKSSLLLAGLQAEGETIVHEPAGTRDHTERMIRQFGGQVESEGLTVRVRGGQQLTAASVTVPGDISSAAFFLAAGAVTENSAIELINVGLNPTRAGILDVLKEMGAKLEITPNQESEYEPIGNIMVQTSQLQGTVIEGELIPRLIDEIPILALLASQAKGKTVIKDAEELKVKETNRIDTVVRELRKLGADIEATEDGMIINGPVRLTGGEVSSHGDHRIGMMLAIASLICKDPVTLIGADAIAVSYPDFFRDLQTLIC